MGKIVAISGGDLDSTDCLNRFAIQLTGKESPNILFIPTASDDALGYINKISDYYKRYNCYVDTLCLYSNTYLPTEIETKFQKADLIYVGGGDTEQMLIKWKAFSICELLLNAYNNGKVMTGISAGANFWFKYGHSDSDYFSNPDNWNYKFVEGLGVFDAALCPHYNEVGRDSFDTMLKDTKTTGLALENDIAFVVVDDHTYIKKANKKAHAYLFTYQDHVQVKTELMDHVEINLLS